MPMHTLTVQATSDGCSAGDDEHEPRSRVVYCTEEVGRLPFARINFKSEDVEPHQNRPSNPSLCARKDSVGPDGDASSG